MQRLGTIWCSQKILLVSFDAQYDFIQVWYSASSSRRAPYLELFVLISWVKMKWNFPFKTCVDRLPFRVIDPTTEVIEECGNYCLLPYIPAFLSLPATLSTLASMLDSGYARLTVSATTDIPQIHVIAFLLFNLFSKMTSSYTTFIVAKQPRHVFGTNHLAHPYWHWLPSHPSSAIWKCVRAKSETEKSEWHSGALPPSCLLVAKRRNLTSIAITQQFPIHHTQYCESMSGAY